jgi:hypothetical protein
LGDQTSVRADHTNLELNETWSEFIPLRTRSKPLTASATLHTRPISLE